MLHILKHTSDTIRFVLCNKTLSKTYWIKKTPWFLCPPEVENQFVINFLL